MSNRNAEKLLNVLLIFVARALHHSRGASEQERRELCFSSSYFAGYLAASPLEQCFRKPSQPG